MTQSWAPQTRYTLRRNTASIMKGFGLARLFLAAYDFEALIMLAYG